MGRRKQFRPKRSGNINLKNDCVQRKDLEVSEAAGERVEETRKPLIVEVDRGSCFGSDGDHRDISEVVLTDLKLSDRVSCCEEFMRESDWKVRIRVESVGEFESRRIKLGHWPVLSSGSVRLEFVVDLGDGVVEEEVVMSGSFDGPDEGVTGLVHLVSLNLVSLRPVLKGEVVEGGLSVGIRVEILKSVFDACESLMDCRRQVWRNSMMNAMAWLRPEVTILEARYGENEYVRLGSDLEGKESSPSEIRARFDASGFYEAIKLSKSVEAFR